ncbi:MAG: hypothetical protein EON59_12285 [Alphaproteobacteria bacterium]|nr:MAG: hypothetical protein EON59_12285 [Alphaproteobacteria bacterium]
MSSFFVVKGELAAWALGLEESDVLSEHELVDLVELPGEPVVPKRRKRRLGHEWYRTPFLRRRELLGR